MSRRWAIFILCAGFLLSAPGSADAATNIDNCSSLGVPGETYVLTQDIINSSYSTCMNVTADNVTLDCNFHRMDGVYTTDTFGAYVSGRNTTLRNCNLTDWWHGIYANASYGFAILNNNLTGTSIGLEIINSLSGNASGNFLNGGSTAVYLSNSSYNVVENNYARSFNTGISLASSSTSNTFPRNKLESISTYAIYIYQSYNNFFRDSNVTATSTNVYHFASTDTIFLNTSLDSSKITVDAGTVYIKWYLDVRAMAEGGYPLGQANVTLKNAYNQTVFQGYTNSSGYAERQNVTEFHQNFTGKYYYSNYSINASRTGFSPNLTSLNVTGNNAATVYLSGIQPPYVAVNVYTTALAEGGIFKPGRTVRIRALANYTLGREYLDNSTILIRDGSGSVRADNEPMVNVSDAENGYIYEYNYTFPDDASGLWSVEVTATSSFSSKGYGYRKIATSLVTMQARLVLNSTSDTVYVPGAGGLSFSNLPDADYVSPPHSYVASYSENALKSVVSALNPVSVFISKGADTFAIGSNQHLQGSMVFLVFSRGGWTAIDNRIGSVEKDEFLSSPEPSFGFGSGNAYPIKVLVKFNDIGLNSSLKLWRGYSRITIENAGISNGKPNIRIDRP